MKKCIFTGSSIVLKALVSILLTVAAIGHLRAQTQTDKQGYSPKVASQGNLFNQLRTDSAQHIPHKYALTRNTTDSTPQLFAWSTPGGDSLILFVNGRYVIIGSGAFVANAGGAVSYQAGAYDSMPLPGSYGRFYAASDSARLYFDNGAVWVNLSGGGYTRTPTDTTILATAFGDTTLHITCGALPGTYTVGYFYVNIPAYLGFRVRVHCDEYYNILDQTGFCAGSIYFQKPCYYTFNSATGDLYVFGVAATGGNLLQIAPY
jgi:hypothetical protein